MKRRRCVGLVMLSAIAAFLGVVGINYADESLLVGIVGALMFPLSVAFGVSLSVALLSKSGGRLLE